MLVCLFRLVCECAHTCARVTCFLLIHTLTLNHYLALFNYFLT